MSTSPSVVDVNDENTLQRGLTSAQVSMIGLSGALGTGLFLGSGSMIGAGTAAVGFGNLTQGEGWQGFAPAGMGGILTAAVMGIFSFGGVESVSVAAAESEGFVKVITEAATGEILGAHIIGADATELIAEYGLAMATGASAQQIHHTIHAHPTLSEAIMEAAAAAGGAAIHI